MEGNSEEILKRLETTLISKEDKKPEIVVKRELRKLMETNLNSPEDFSISFSYYIKYVNLAEVTSEEYPYDEAVLEPVESKMVYKTRIGNIGLRLSIEEPEDFEKDTTTLLEIIKINDGKVLLSLNNTGGIEYDLPFIEKVIKRIYKLAEEGKIEEKSARTMEYILVLLYHIHRKIFDFAEGSIKEDVKPIESKVEELIENGISSYSEHVIVEGKGSIDVKGKNITIKYSLKAKL